MKKVLFIAPLFPPIANSGTQRSVKFSKYLPDFEWEPIVLTVDNLNENPLDASLLHEVRPGTHVERVPFWSDLIASKIGNSFRLFYPEKRLVEGLSWRIRSLWNIPDEWIFWRRPAVERAIEIFNRDKFDCIYASGYPWSSFLVARDVAKVTGKPYVLDFRDLWCSWTADWSRKTSWFSCWIAHRQEQIVVKDASAIITTTESMVSELSKIKNSGRNGKVICITNGFDELDFNVPPAERDKNKIRIVYTGVWKKGYSPIDLYYALKKLVNENPRAARRFEVVCAGFPPGSFGDSQFNGIISELGRVSHKDAIALMKSADILFLPVSGGEYALGSLPGKLFEYLATGKPIIAAAPDASEVVNILNQVGGAAQVDPGDVESLSKLLLNISRAEGPAWVGSNQAQNARFGRRMLAKQLAEVLSQVSERSTL